MTFSGLSLPSNRLREIGTGCRQPRLTGRYGAAPIDPTEGRCLGSIQRRLARSGTTRYSDKIISRLPGQNLRERLSADCERHDAAEYERCDLYFPDILKVN